MKKKSKKMYLVEYVEGYWEYSYRMLFVTDSKKKAENYVKKFNSIVKKWQEYFKQFTDEQSQELSFLKDEYYDSWIFNRYHQIAEINKAFYTEIEER